jgi:glycosyltransferase involved in cell wall biosynthesis
MADVKPADLAIVIPTRDRWDILGRALASLRNQTVTGFESIVVVDGTDQKPPPVDASRLFVTRRAGPGAARNAGVRATERPIVMFLGDDTIPAPDLVEKHLAAHRRHPERQAGVVGFVDWHPEVANNRINGWLEWSGTQSWYASLADEGEQEVSHWYFYTSNISVKRELLLETDGFDEDFPFAAFEDLEYGVRLSRLGLRLYYEPGAVCHHLHNYDWPALERRFACMAVSERLMVDMHPDIQAGCLSRMKAATSARALPVDAFVGTVPRRLRRLDGLIRQQVDRRYHRRLAPTYLRAWDRAAELCELRRYLGEGHDSGRLVYRSEPRSVEPRSVGKPDAEPSEEERLFALARRGLEGRTDHAVSLLQRCLPAGSSILEYGCGIGTDGLRLAEEGHSVRFADRSGLPLAYLKWRIANRGLSDRVYDLGSEELPAGFDAVFCFDVASPGWDPVALFDQLQNIAPIVALGFFPETEGSSRIAIPAELLTTRHRSGALVSNHQLSGGSVLLISERGRGRT